MQPFAEPQAVREDRPEVGPVIVSADGINEAPLLLDRERVGELLVPPDAELFKRDSVTGCGVGNRRP